MGMWRLLGTEKRAGEWLNKGCPGDGGTFLRTCFGDCIDGAKRGTKGQNQWHNDKETQNN